MNARRAFFALATFLFDAGAANSQSSIQSVSYEAALDDWSRVLVRFVDDEGRTDFLGLSENREELDRFVAYIGRVSPASHSDEFSEPADVLSYHINAYNALAMHEVLEAGIPAGFTNFLSRAIFFKFRTIVVGGSNTSLYDYENTVIRPLGEPRVHFALNCMVRDCPRLPTKPFRAKTLGAQLETAAREFFSKPRHLRVDAQNREVWLSEILDFYTQDFADNGSPGSLIRYVNRYVSIPIDAAYRVRFIPYDWKINKQP